MGAFCVFGVSRALCLAKAAKSVPAWSEDLNRHFTMEEWAAARDAEAERLFADDGSRCVKISPEFDAPQFCNDWIAVAPQQVRSTVLMVRGPKRDEHGAEIKRNGAVVLTWLNYEAECERLGLTKLAA